MGKTEDNLRRAFAGESMARNKYDYFAKQAGKEGYLYIAKIFEETALNERQHAKDEFKKLKPGQEGPEAVILGAAGIGTTEENLREAIAGEHYEWAEMYPKFEKEAREEGNEEAAKLFKEISEVEERHELRYKALLEMVQKGTVYKRDRPIEWKCSKCGYRHTGTEPPEECPSCRHAREYYEPSDMSIIPPREPEK
jgi:rubrerythrin